MHERPAATGSDGRRCSRPRARSSCTSAREIGTGVAGSADESNTSRPARARTSLPCERYWPSWIRSSTPRRPEAYTPTGRRFVTLVVTHGEDHDHVNAVPRLGGWTGWGVGGRAPEPWPA